MRAGRFEVEELAIIRRQLQQADVFVDVGANIGLYTCLACSFGKRVVAIEPQRRNLDSLYENLITNHWQNTEVYPLGLGSQVGLAVLYGASGPSASLISGWANYPDYFRQTIPVSTLDTLLGERFAGQRLLIKIDVEGAEYEVLRGATHTLTREPRPMWMIEVCLHEYHPGGVNPHYTDTFELFWQHGYEARTANQVNRHIERAEVVEWVNAHHSGSGTFNYLFMSTP